MHDGVVHAHRYKEGEVNVECRGGERGTGGRRQRRIYKWRKQDPPSVGKVNGTFARLTWRGNK